MKRAAIDGDEQDAFSKRSRRALIWLSKPGATSRIKRKARRRERQAAKEEIRNDQEGLGN